jgi:hypothetical protein
MWPFSYFKRKKEEALEKKRQEELHQLQLRKEKYNQYKEYIDSVISQFESEEDDKRNEYMDKVREENKIHNQTCPNCGSKNTIQVFRRPKGEIHGSLNGYSSYDSYLFGSYSSHRSFGKIDGNLDTLKVNQCKECGQEWEHKDEKQIVYRDYWYSGKCNRYENVSSFLRRVWYLIEDIEKYDPNKLDNPCNSVQEFIEMKKEEICKHWGRGVLDLSMEVLHYYARCNSFSLVYKDKILEEYTKDDGGRLYLGKFTPKMEDFLINKFGFKYYFNE